MTAVQPVTNCHKVLRSLIDMLIPGTSKKASQILNKDLTRETYIDYLIDLYHMVVAVVPQMQAAIDTLKKEDKRIILFFALAIGSNNTRKSRKYFPLLLDFEVLLKCWPSNYHKSSLKLKLHTM